MFDRSREQIPSCIDTVAPGHLLACMLSAIDVDKVSGYDRIRVLRAHQRIASLYAAHIYRDMTAVVDAMELDENEEGFSAEAAAAEVRAALRLTRRAADSEMSFAVDLQRRLPLVWQALCAGAIDVRRARVMADGTAHLPLAAARDLIDHLIADAGLPTTGQLSAGIRKLAIEVDAEDGARRYEQAVAERRIVTDRQRRERRICLVSICRRIGSPQA